MYTPESILFPYNTLILAQFRVKNKPCSTTKNEQSAPGGGLYGLVGKALGRYNLHTGGNREGTRIPRLFQENITEAEILQILDGWFADWAAHRQAGEGFGDFAVRSGIVKPVLDAPRDFWVA